MYKWPLAVSTFGLIDRLKICSFFLNFKNRWTQGEYVKKYEEVAAKFAGTKYALLISSGSTANQLIAQQIKDKLIQNREWPHRNKIIVNAVTWQTNVSVFVREGFEPIFIDVNFGDFCLNYEKLEKYLKINHNKTACVFPTSVLGYVPNISKLKILEKEYPKIKFALDNCENFFGDYNKKNICSFFTCSTSGFVAHHINCGTEAGLIFTNSQEEYEYFLLARAHGLRRNLISYPIDRRKIDSHYTNSLVDSQFDFQILSSNYRSSDITAFIALLDAQKWNQNKHIRIKLYNIFSNNLDRQRYFLPIEKDDRTNVAFCYPIIVLHDNRERYRKVKKLLDELNIEQRSFISGNMLRQKPYQKYGCYKTYRNAEYLNNFAVYIGLHPHLKEKDILDLCKRLNSL